LYHSGDNIKKNEMGKAWGSRGSGEDPTGLWCENLMGGDHLKYLGVDRRIILKWTFKK
jgi:hypothetical protein